MSKLYGRKCLGTVSYMGGIPFNFEEFTWSFANMVAYNYEALVMPNEYIHYDRSKVSYHAYARNTLANRMLGDWIVMLDTDHRFDPDIVARLLHFATRHKLDVLTGAYTYRNHPFAPVLFQWVEGGGYVPIGGWDKGVEVFQIDSSGAGCLFVRRGVFEKIRRDLKCEPFDVEEPYSEDHSFFNRLRKVGIKAFCCPLIEAEHLMVRPLRIADSKITPEMLGPRKEVQGFVQLESARVGVQS